ncbi:poly-gamma-glutamate synthesis protein (capsule biosynthesis protein) [Streptoalloteichus tenebrarius]|uniref:Poly-gamma-glutamate synthesis protein (Capsule biosynthesis protein) n=1 Tax=Streptoalloteichus tenebrarius (strain ATCC 17920 / DSM 40477 / JCM 4838 / CBS 697.72 / NBRC 16177 / NCIMB 11028 / NRRL B-12390 / A12253. 1 / ISP 5477) TaxID=1933 RepID=A0ABT1HU93_STRSD|nr:CapA family protein [Streptoalloteichus tenebrarius]MCP2259098.1 poly-gamma-glutamate synthesis protein (capsule biosynthesis protein) [Streptoalloteichus tenebrarius]BFE99576.1 CapA family protein [Streptoalloteichus tenebrarius]
MPGNHGLGRVFCLVTALAVGGCVGPPDPARDPGLDRPTATSAAPGSVAVTAASTFTVVATGDVLIHQEGALVRQAAAAGAARGVGYDFGRVFTDVAPVVEGADLAICHLETPVSEPGGPFTGYPAFSVQPQIIDALRGAGYDTCSTASNHSLDAGFPGLARTLDALDARGMRHTGTFRTAEESRTPLLLDVGGVRVGHLAWTYGLNGIPKPEGREWSVNVFDPDVPEVDGMLAEARRVREAGADVVIATVHCCEEYVHEPPPNQVEIARRLLASPDVDLVIGHHGHVVQPFERINGKWVAYGLGNHVAEQGRGETEDSVVARFTFSRDAHGRYTVTRAEAVPTVIHLDGETVRVVNTAAHRDAHPASYQRIVEVLNSRGAAGQGLVIAES